ncbi:nSTAND1 domain-containing NTPase [Streptomyces acidicola]|uniref:nSTAND1 domain-containing NTPase n=1 Tax=Streptomyces acidicola TaxID=2596892 RepID=UPI00382BF078
MGRREKPLDPMAGPVQRFAYELRKLRDDAGTPTYRAMALRTGYSGPTLSAAAAGERLPTSAVLRAYVTVCGGDPDVWERRLREAAAEETDGRAADHGDSPYPGLARFGPDDHDRFHGRDDMVAELLELTIRRRFSAVVGASGSGKSSLLRAGLIPALRRSAGLAAIRVLTPGTHPVRTHEALFTPYPGDGDTLLVVDQFEELFALCADPAERAAFTERLLTALAPESRLRVIVAVRADFYGRCADDGPLAEALRDSTLLVGPMTPRQLRDAVVRPAVAARLVVERALTARVVADVTGEPGGLPLMAHALREVWRRRTARTLTLQAYEDVGGVQGAVAHTAEEVYARCPPAEATAVRALLLRLVNPGDGTEDTRRPVDRTELAADARTTAVLERLVRARLLTVDGDTVELAHEALIRAWPRLRDWVDEDRDRLRLRRHLTDAARSWQDLDRDVGALYRGLRLTAARDAFGEGRARKGELSPLEADFLAVSVAEHERGRRTAARVARRMRALTVSLAVLLCLAVIAGGTAWRQSGVSARQRDEAEARRVAAFADTLRADDPRTAMRLALAAWRTADLPETREALRTAAAQSDQDAFIQPESVRALNAPVWLSGDGRILTTVVRNQAVQWDVRHHRRIRTVERPGLSRGVVDVSADGRWIAYRGDGGTTVLDLADGRTHSLPTGSWTNTDAAFGPSGRTLLVRHTDTDTDTETDSDRATIEVWDFRREKAVFRYSHGESGGPLPALSEGDRFLAWCADDGERLIVRDVVERRRVPGRPSRGTERLLCQADELTFTPDERALAAGTTEGVVTWDFRAGRDRPLLPAPEGLHSVRFDRTGRYALAWGGEQLALWRTDPPAPRDDGPREPLIRFPLFTTAIGDIRLDAEDGVLRYRQGGQGNVVRTITLHGLLGRAWRDRPPTAAAFDREGKPVPPGPRYGVRSLAPDGTVHTAVGTDEGIRVTWSGTRRGGWTIGTPQESAVAIDTRGRTVLTGDGKLIDTATGGYRTGVVGEDHLGTAAFSEDGRYLAAADPVGRVTLWDARAWRRLAVLVAADSTVATPALAFSRDGALLAAGASDGSVRVWETASPQLRGAVLPVGDGPLLAVGFTADGGRLGVATPHLPLRGRWLEPRRAAKEVCARARGGATEAQWRRYLPSVPYRETC